MTRPCRRLPVVAAVALLAGVLGGCASGGEQPAEPGVSAVPFEVHLSPADDGTTQQVLLGGKVVLDLPGGSTWEYDEPADYPDPALASYCPIPTGSGGGTTEGAREVFEAVRIGTTTLAYVRDGGPERFDVAFEIVGGPGAAAPSTQLAGVLLRAQDEASTVHVPRNGVVLVELPGQASITNPEGVAEASGRRLVSYCVLDPQRVDDQWTSRIKVTAVREGSTDLVVAHDPDGSGSRATEVFRATVVVDPAPSPSASAPAPTTSAGAPFVLELSDRDAGRTVDVLRGGKVIVTLPDPDGADAGWFALGGVMGLVDEQQQLWVRCGGAADSWAWTSQTTRGPVGEGPVVLEVGPILGTVPLKVVYVAYDGETWSEQDTLDTFDVTLRIVDGPGATLPSLQVEGARVDAEDDGGSVEVDRNGFVGVTLVGQHALGRDWELVSAGEVVRAFCPPRVISEGPGSQDMGYLNEFTFTGMSPGVSEIELEYRGAADPGVVLDTFRLTVTVR